MGRQSKQKHEKRAAGEPRVAVSAPLHPSRRRDVAVVASLIVAVLAVYAQVRTHSFINFDDPLYVTRNAHVLQGLSAANIRWAFGATVAANWHPLTILSHMLDVSLFGRDAGWHLLINVAMHAASAALLYAWLRLAQLPWTRSAVVAALFALHPLRVESVAWVSERKDVLSTLFFILMLIAWTRFAQTRSRTAYGGSLAALALGLLSKPMLVTAPFVLLLIDEWPLHRAISWRDRVVEKLPHFALSAAFVIITLRTQASAMPNSVSVPLLIRIANAFRSYVLYLGKTFWPSRLAVLYPYQSPSTIASIVFAVVIIAITLAALRWHRTAPWFAVGWFWYLGTLVPVIGIVQVGLQSMADRYTYTPHIGLFLALVWGVAELAARRPDLRAALPYAAAAVVFVLSAVTFAQLRHWQNSRTLFEHTLAVTSSGNSLAHVNLGETLLEQGDYAAAEREYRAGISFQPTDIVHTGLALALAGEGKLDDAAAEARKARAANPNSADALDALGSIELSRGNLDEAVRILGQTAQRKNDPAVLARLAVAKNDVAEAQRRFAQAVELHPEDATLHNSYAAVLARGGNDAQATVEYETAIRLSPTMYDARMNYAALLSRSGRDADAVRELAEAARLRPQSPEPLVYLALVESNGRRFTDAASHVEQAIRADHDAANRYLTDAIRIAPKETNIDEYLAFLRTQANGR
jgi:Flp pilus assembly protein TadD